MSLTENLKAILDPKPSLQEAETATVENVLHRLIDAPKVYCIMIIAKETMLFELASKKDARTELQRLPAKTKIKIGVWHDGSIVLHTDY